MDPEDVAAAIAAATEQYRTGLDDLTRRQTVLEQTGNGIPDAAIHYRSLGEYLKALGDRRARPATFDAAKDAELLTRAYTGAVLADSGLPGTLPTWIDRDIKLVTENRDVLNFFNSEALPAEGMSIAYPKFGSKTGDVAIQVNEGDDLTYLELTISDGNAPVKTYGGYSSLSRQAIERNPVSYLNKVLQMQAISYAKVTNGVIRTVLTAGAATYNQLTLPFADKGKAIAWTLLALDGCAAIHQNSLALEAEKWWMSLAAFRDLASVVDTSGRPVFVINGDGVNSVGDVSVRNLSANVAGLPVGVDLGLTGVSSYICSSRAITVLESGGAPYHLNDENVINLTKDFSLYGYLAATTDDAKGITRVQHPIS